MTNTRSIETVAVSNWIHWARWWVILKSQFSISILKELQKNSFYTQQDKFIFWDIWIHIFYWFSSLTLHVCFQIISTTNYLSACGSTKGCAVYPKDCSGERNNSNTLTSKRNVKIVFLQLRVKVKWSWLMSNMPMGFGNSLKNQV